MFIGSNRRGSHTDLVIGDSRKGFCIGRNPFDHHSIGREKTKTRQVEG